MNALGFIEELPASFEEPVEERGVTLSVGQKQLLCFARALAHHPRILILDEATSSIDPQTEYLIREALHRLLENRTALVIAHRLSTIQNASKIIVMHKGRVREMGTHQELLDRAASISSSINCNTKIRRLAQPGREHDWGLPPTALPKCTLYFYTS